MIGSSLIALIFSIKLVLTEMRNTNRKMNNWNKYSKARFRLSVLLALIRLLTLCLSMAQLKVWHRRDMDSKPAASGRLESLRTLDRRINR
jgi:hypothetical protein